MFKFKTNIDPIDCTTDYCHMAWLIRDHPNYLSNVRYSGCSNGTRFEDLNPNGYNDCI